MLGLFVTIQTVALLYTQVHAFPCHDWIILNNSVLPIRHTVRILLRKVNNCSLSVSKSLIKKKTSIAEKNPNPNAHYSLYCLLQPHLFHSSLKGFKKDDRWVRFYPSNCQLIHLSLQPLRHLQDPAGLYVGFTFVLNHRTLIGNTEVVCESLINLK